MPEQPTSSRRTVLKQGVAVGTAGLLGVNAAGGASASDSQAATDPADRLPVNEFSSGSYPGTNELGEWSSHIAVADDELVDDTLRLSYDDGGFFGSVLLADLSAYTHLELVVRGDDGGEEDEIDLRIGNVRDTLSNLTDDSIGTELSTVRVDLVGAGVDRSAVRELRLGFWNGGHGAVELDEIAFVEADSGLTESTTLAEFYPEYEEEYVPRAWTQYLPGEADGGHGDADQVNWPDEQKADAFDVDLDAIETKVDDGSLTFGEMGTQALSHVRAYEAQGFPRQASAKLLPRLSLLPDETEPLTYHNEPMNFWEETAGPEAATNDPDQLIQDPWPTDAVTYDPEEVRERDRAHDQPQHEADDPDVEWTRHDQLPEDRYYDDENPIHLIADKIHPATKAPMGGDGFTANAPMQCEAKIHVENAGFWYQVLEFKNLSAVPHHLDAAVITWIGPSGANGQLRTGHYNNEQRPQPGYGHPQRDVIEVVHDEARSLSAYAIRLAFHDEPYQMRTAFPNQRWALEQGLTPPDGFETSEQRQELVETMVSTCHVELETDMDRNDDLLDALDLRNRMTN